jgi:hypothetical protein
LPGQYPPAVRSAIIYYIGLFMSAGVTARNTS